MTRSKEKRGKKTLGHPRVSPNEPLQSKFRDDGLWESIETDDSPASGEPKATHDLSGRTDSLREMKSVGVQTSSQAHVLPAQATPYPKRYTSVENGSCQEADTTPTTEDITARVRQLTLPQPLPGLASAFDDAAAGAPVAADGTGTRRRRGRPPRNPLSGIRHRRSVRFSDPGPLSECEPELRWRDSHVFVRLLSVVVELEGAHSAGRQLRQRQRQRHVLSWNNRGKGWRVAGRQSDEGFGEIVSLFELPPSTGVELYPLVLPTERGGVRQQVSMAWDGPRACFLGRNQDGETLSVTLGEMRDMARDPWARQFVGYIMGGGSGDQGGGE